MYDLDNTCVYVKRFRKYNAGGQPNLIRLSIISDVKLLHMSKLWNEFIKDYPIYADEVINTLKQLDNSLPTNVSKVREGKVTLNTKVTSNEINNGNRNVFEIFEDNYQKITAETSARLNDLINEYTENKVKWALQIGIDSNARNLRYVEKALENDKQGIKKPQTNVQVKSTYQPPINQYKDYKDYGKQSNPTP
jgi:hypothetical protein